MRYLSGLSSIQFKEGYNKSSRTFNKFVSNRNMKKLLSIDCKTFHGMGSLRRYLGREQKDELLDEAGLDDRLHVIPSINKSFEFIPFFTSSVQDRGMTKAAYHAGICASNFGGQRYVFSIETEKLLGLCTNEEVSVKELYHISRIGFINIIRDISCKL